MLSGLEAVCWAALSTSPRYATAGKTTWRGDLQFADIIQSFQLSSDHLVTDTADTAAAIIGYP